jgi:hypothetical protein
MRRISVFPLFCALLVLLMFACSSKPRSVEGKWQETNKRETIQFNNDGTFKGVMIWDINLAPITLSGTYKIQGDKLDLVVTDPKNLTPMKWTVQFFSGDEMLLTFVDGGTLKRDGTSARYRKIT